MRTSNCTFVATLAALALGACGGGGGDKDTDRPGADQPPASEAASVNGFIGYLQGITADRSETATPVDVSAFTAPTSDTDEPAAL